MKFFFLLCCTVFHCLSGAGQKSFPEKFILKTSPLAPLDPTNPSLITGIEFRFKPQFGVQAEYGLKCNARNAFRKEEDNRQYYKLKFEGRYYPSWRWQDVKAFMGLGYLLVPQRFEVQSYQYWKLAEHKAYQVDGAKVRRNISSVMVRFGFYFYFPNSRFIIETGMGIGPRFVSQHLYNEVNKTEIPEVLTPRTDWINTSYNNFSGTETRLNLESNLRIGWKLGRRL